MLPWRMRTMMRMALVLVLPLMMSRPRRWSLLAPPRLALAVKETATQVLRPLLLRRRCRSLQP